MGEIQLLESGGEDSEGVPCPYGSDNAMDSRLAEDQMYKTADQFNVVIRLQHVVKSFLATLLT